MSYEYANARIRALRGRLLRADGLAALARLGGVAEILTALARTDLGPDIEALGVAPATVAAVDEAVRRNVTRRLRGMARFFEDGSAPRALVRVLLARYDLENLVAIVRGKAAGATAEEILGSVVPVGDLDDERLAALAEAPDFAATAALLAAWSAPLAPVLAEALPGYRERGRLADVEVALRRGFTGWVRASLAAGDPNTTLMREWCSLDESALRLRAAARLAGHGAAASTQATGGEAAPARHAGLARAVAEADPTTELDEAMRAESAILGYRARWARAQLLAGPLGIAVAVCYVAEKEQEARSLRLVARGRSQ